MPDQKHDDTIRHLYEVVGLLTGTATANADDIALAHKLREIRSDVVFVLKNLAKIQEKETSL